MPEWLEEKLMQQLRMAYAYSVEQSSKIPRDGFKALEEGLEERVREVGIQLLQAGIERGLGKGYSGSRVACECGGRKRYVEDREKVVTTRLGDARARRAYYHCAECKEGTVPLDEMLDIVGSSFSPGVREMICLTAAEIPFERGRRWLKEIAGLRVSVEESRLIAEAKGRELEGQAQAEIERVWQAKTPKPREIGRAPERLYLSPDGTHVPVRGEKEWKEIKVGTVFTAPVPARGQEPVRERTRYVAGFENAELFYRRLYVEALKQGIEEAAEVVVIGDGADWIWKNAEISLPGHRIEIIDFYHASEKLWTLARCVWGDESAQAKRWAGRWSDKLYVGKVKETIAAMRRIRCKAKAARETQRTTVDYFEKNRRRMDYGRLRKQGYFIGSGVTESSCKHLIGARFKQAGMHWNKPDAQAIVQLRIAMLNDRWAYQWN
jgi:hypothetical protein